MMKIRTTTMQRWTRWSALAALATILVAAPVMAGQPAGIAQLEAVNLARSTITLKGEVYQVSNATLMVDANGRGTELELLRPMPQEATIVADSDVDVVKWEAVETRNGWIITDLKLMKAMPR